MTSSNDEQEDDPWSTSTTAEHLPEAFSSTLYIYVYEPLRAALLFRRTPQKNKKLWKENLCTPWSFSPHTLCCVNTNSKTIVVWKLGVLKCQAVMTSPKQIWIHSNMNSQSQFGMCGGKRVQKTDGWMDEWRKSLFCRGGGRGSCCRLSALFLCVFILV